MFLLASRLALPGGMSPNMVGQRKGTLSCPRACGILSEDERAFSAVLSIRSPFGSRRRSAADFAKDCPTMGLDVLLLATRRLDTVTTGGCPHRLREALYERTTVRTASQVN
jgi:hypothetical protein